MYGKREQPPFRPKAGPPPAQAEDPRKLSERDGEWPEIELETNREKDNYGVARSD